MADKKPDQPAGSEPQSYGSQDEWLTGKTGQTVDGTPHKTSRTDEGFYESRREDRSTTTQPSPGRSPVDKSVENDATPDPAGSTTEDIPRKSS